MHDGRVADPAEHFARITEQWAAGRNSVDEFRIVLQAARVHPRSRGGILRDTFEPCGISRNCRYRAAVGEVRVGELVRAYLARTRP